MKMTKSNKKIAWGLFFILAGCWLIAERIWDLPKISIWSVIITLICIKVLITGVLNRNFYKILFPIAILAIVYDEFLGITELTPWPVLGAAFLGSIGFSMIIRPKKKLVKYQTYFGDNHDVVVDESNFHCTNSFGSEIRYVNSDNFQYAYIENNFGSSKVFFDHAVIADETATIQVENNFGEVILGIPRNWNVYCSIERAFGSVETQGSSDGTSNATVYVKGETNFGTVLIRYI